MRTNRKCWTLFLTLLAAGVPLLRATPTITSVSGCPNGPSLPPQITAGVTAGAPFPNSFPLCIFGSFTIGNSPTTVWHDVATGATATFTAANSNITATSIQVFVPQALVASVANPLKPDPITITVTEGANVATSSFQINPPLTPASGAFTGPVGSPLSATLYTFGTPPYSNVLNNGSGPPGMGGLPPNSPVWSGTPSQTGTYNFVFTVTDVWNSHITPSESFNIVQAPLLITSTTPITSGMVGVVYTYTFQATGGSGGYTFSVKQGPLPPGLAFGPTGLLSGTPTTFGTYSFTIQVTDSSTNVTSGVFTMTVAPARLTVTTPPLSNAIVNTPLSIQFAATGGVPPYTFVEFGPLPPGTTFSSAGLLSGTPTTLGTYQFQVFADDSTTASASQAYTLSIVSAGLVITTASPLKPGVISSPYSTTFAATGGQPPYTWSATGVPPGLVLSSTTGLLTGIPTQSGVFSLAVTVTSSTAIAVISTTANFSLTISPLTLTITNTSLPNGAVGSAYTATLSALGGTAPISFTATGLPPGLTISTAGVLTGTPTTAGTYQVLINATDVNGLAARAPFTIVIAPQLVITSSTITGAILGSSLNTKLVATGGTPPYTWLGTGLPGGLSLALDGTLSGAPTVAGAATFTVTVLDSNGISTSKSLSITVALPPAPGLTFTGIGTTVPPATQPSVGITLGSTYPTNITVKLTLSVVTDSGLTDPAFQFASGGLTAQTTVPAGSTGALTTVPVQMGTDAATVTITAQLLVGTQDVTPTPAPKTSFRLNAAAPVITSMTATRTSTGFTVTIVGYATSRDVTSASFTFSATSGSNLQTTQIPVTVSSIFAPWYSSATSAPYGSQFTFTQPFTVTGSNSAVLSVSATLTNSVGTSPASSANLQ